MRRILPFLCIIGLLLLTASPLYAGAIINKSNQSVDYLRTMNRAAATDYADAAHYNPAGIMKMDDGGYAKLDVMYFAKDYSNTVPGLGELSQDEPSIIPGIFALYKSDKWAGYFTTVVVAGGGEVDYKNGNVRTVNGLQDLGIPAFLLPTIPQRAQADSVYMGYTLGGAYAINDMFSVSLAARYVDAYKELTLSASNLPPNPLGSSILVDVEDTADGWGGIIGLNITPNDQWNIGIRYESKVKLDFELKIKQGQAAAGALGFTNGRKEREDLPALLSLGGAYKFTDAFKLDGSFVYYFEKDATWESGLDGAGNSWEIGIAGEYILNPQWKISGGFLWTDIKIDNSQLDVVPEEPKLDARSLGVGAVWSPFPSWSFTASGTYIMYEEETDSNGFSYDKTVWSLGIGAQWKFL